MLVRSESAVRREVRASRREVLRKPYRSSRGIGGDCELGTPELAVCAAHIGESSALEKSRLNRSKRPRGGGASWKPWG